MGALPTEATTKHHSFSDWFGTDYNWNRLGCWLVKVFSAARLKAEQPARESRCHRRRHRKLTPSPIKTIWPYQRTYSIYWLLFCSTGLWYDKSWHCRGPGSEVSVSKLVSWEFGTFSVTMFEDFFSPFNDMMIICWSGAGTCNTKIWDNLARSQLSISPLETMQFWKRLSNENQSLKQFDEPPYPLSLSFCNHATNKCFLFIQDQLLICSWTVE